MRKIFSTLIFFCAIILTTTANAENWRYVTINVYGSWYIDTQTAFIDQSADDEFLFHVLVKKQLSDSGRKLVGNDNLLYTVYLEEFRFKDNKKYFRVVQATNYTRNGRFSDDPTSIFDWDEIPPNTVAESLYNAAYIALNRTRN